MFINHIKSSPLGGAAIFYVKAFDLDETLRFELLRFRPGSGVGYPYDYVEPEILARKLNDHVSAVWWREGTIEYFQLIGALLEKIRGKEVILTSENAYIFEIVEDLQPKWLANSKLRDTVFELQKSLEEAIFWFNVQLLVNWISDRIFRGQSEAYPFPEQLHGLTREIVSQEQGDLDRLTYGEAEGIVRTKAGNSLAKLHEISNQFYTLLYMDQNQLMLLSASRRGAKIPIAKLLRDPEEIEADIPGEVYEQSSTGLWVPIAKGGEKP